VVTRISQELRLEWEWGCPTFSTT